MWRSRAVRALLVGDVASLRWPREHEADEAAEGEAAPDAVAESAVQLEVLAKAQRRARLAVALDWVAIAVLFLFRRTEEPFLALGGDLRTVFTVGILAVAIHSGFRLGQLEKYRAVERALRELTEREAG